MGVLPCEDLQPSFAIMGDFTRPLLDDDDDDDGGGDDERRRRRRG